MIKKYVYAHLYVLGRRYCQIGGNILELFVDWLERMGLADDTRHSILNQMVFGLCCKYEVICSLIDKYFVV